MVSIIIVTRATLLIVRRGFTWRSPNVRIVVVARQSAQRRRARAKGRFLVFVPAQTEPANRHSSALF
jgi:hypothetical protein